ncbi:MAG: hypothetical protein ACE5EX_00980 [Phycisphaerae bacterium]
MVGARGETWEGINTALRKGARGFRGGTSLFQILNKHRGVRNTNGGGVLTTKQVLAWADEYHRRHGKWPSCRRGDAVPGVPWESWLRINAAFIKGLRGLGPGGSSLARFLNEHRGVPYRNDLPRLTLKQILAWADAYHDRTGDWPMLESGRVPDAPHETWSGLNASLRVGRRGLKGGDSLANLLERRRRVRKRTRRRFRAIPGGIRRTSRAKA